MKFSAKRIARLALMTAVICVTSSIQIPIGAVPITLQTFFIALTGALLGPADACIALVVYLLLGTIGLPVFSGWKAGLGVLMGATGGFLLGFPLFGAACGMFRKSSLWKQIACSLAGLVLLDAIGTLQLKTVLSMDWRAAFMAGVAPFLIKDIVCVIAAALIARKIAPRLGQ